MLQAILQRFYEASFSEPGFIPGRRRIPSFGEFLLAVNKQSWGSVIDDSIKHTYFIEALLRGR